MTFSRTILSLIAAAVLFISCTAAHPPDGSAQRYAAVIGQYAQADAALRIQRLEPESYHMLGSLTGSREVIIVVHPGYSFFFTLGKKTRYRGAKYRLMEYQFETEARFLTALAHHQGSILILIVPGEYASESSAPLAYTEYLNRVEGPAVFYLPSETSSNGTIATDDMVTLFHFLQEVRAERVLIGGGYIGRCQREFHQQLTTYFDERKTFIIREVSAISPEDVSYREAAQILTRLQQQDYVPVSEFISRRLGGDVNIMDIPPAPDR